MCKPEGGAKQGGAQIIMMILTSINYVGTWKTREGGKTDEDGSENFANII